MTAAGAQLRVLDADGRFRGAVALTLARYELGADRNRRGDVDYLLLDGGDAALRHARLARHRESGDWSLEVVADALTRVGGLRLRQGDRYPLRPGSEIRLGNNLIQLVAPGLSSPPAAVAPTLEDVEATLNRALLDYEDNNRDLFQTAGADRRQLLADELERQIELKLADADGVALADFAGAALRRTLISMALLGGREPPAPYSRMIADTLRQALRLRQELVATLALDLGARTTAADIGRIRDRWDAAWAAHRDAAPIALLRDIVRDAAREQVLNLFFRYGPLQLLLDVDEITEIMVNGHKRVFVEKNGEKIETGVTLSSEEELLSIVRRIASADNKQLTMGEPMVDARLSDGSRVNIAIPPIALKGTSLTVRKFGADARTLDDYVALDAMSGPMATFLQACVRARKNIIVSGGTGSGKTTLLNTLARCVAPGERVVTIEDTAELVIDIPNLVGLEGRRATSDGTGEVSIRALVRNALRMRPDRIIVGECRGGEALDMLQAMNTGHDGSMTTAHANSPVDLMLRLETMVMQSGETLPLPAVRQQIAAAVDIVVQLRQLAHLGAARKIVAIEEVGDYDPETGEVALFPIFEFIDGGPAPRFIVSGYEPSFFHELLDKDLIDPARFLGA